MKNVILMIGFFLTFAAFGSENGGRIRYFYYDRLPKQLAPVHSAITKNIFNLDNSPVVLTFTKKEAENILPELEKEGFVFSVTENKHTTEVKIEMPKVKTAGYKEAAVDAVYLKVQSLINECPYVKSEEDFPDEMIVKRKPYSYTYERYEEKKLKKDYDNSMKYCNLEKSLLTHFLDYSLLSLVLPEKIYVKSFSVSNNPIFIPNLEEIIYPFSYWMSYSSR